MDQPQLPLCLLLDSLLVFGKRKCREGTDDVDHPLTLYSAFFFCCERCSGVIPRLLGEMTQPHSVWSPLEDLENELAGEISDN